MCATLWLRVLSASAPTPTPIIGGTLADFVLEPALRTDSALTSMFGWLVGTGPGAGMGLLIVICGVLITVVGIAGFFIPAVREAEDRLPDYDKIPLAVQPASAAED